MQTAPRGKRKQGRPRIGEGSAKFYTSMERGLLRRFDAYVKANRTTRAAVIARCVESILRGK
jgi:hypothetical protein